jgi:tetratricopeptide (TPR) repeat protein
MLVEQVATAPLMLLYTARPEFHAPWPMRAHHVQVTLNRLNDRQTREMVAGVAARVALAKEVIDTVVKRTDGVPLFAEELTRLILEGDGHPVAREIPATLNDSLSARLDRLGPAREVAQVAAVIGREFTYELLHAVSPMPENELQSSLEKLADAELIYTRGIPPEAIYQFKHGLIHDAAYEALLKSKRKELHRRVARAITEKFSKEAEAQPQILARHWTEAGDAEPAIAAWKAAGDTANARRAFKEAEESYRQALVMLGTLPESPERDARELALMSPLVQVLAVTAGYSAPETFEAAARARALAEKGGNLAQLFQQAFWSWSAVIVSGDYASASALADQLLDLAQREGSHTSIEFARHARMVGRFYRGDLVGAEEHFARVSGSIQESGLSQLPGAIVITIAFGSLGAWALGHADLARERIAWAIALAGDSKNPYDLAFGRFFESYLYRFQREPQQAEAAATQVLTICEELGFSYCRDLARNILGWALAQLGHTAEGVSLIRQGLAGVVEAGARVGITDFLTHLAEAQALDSATGDALGTIEVALQANPEELILRPQALTCRGVLRLKLGQTDSAEGDFREAIALARKMSGKTWELRATTSLARLLAKQSKRDEARAMLADVYNWFTEGFDTADLKDAKALLDELSR